MRLLRNPERFLCLPFLGLQSAFIVIFRNVFFNGIKLTRAPIYIYDKKKKIQQFNNLDYLHSTKLYGRQAP